MRKYFYLIDYKGKFTIISDKIDELDYEVGTISKERAIKEAEERKANAEYYTIKLNKVGDNIIGFDIIAKNLTRYYPMYLSNEFEMIEEFISRKTKDFLNEIKDYRKPDYLLKI